MAILGYQGTDTPGDNYFFDDFGNTEWWGPTLNLPTGGGIVTDCYVYVGGDGAAVTGQLVIWGGSAILWQSGNITIPAGSRSVRGQNWVHQSVPNVYMGSGTLHIGWWSSGNVVWTMYATGSTGYLRSQSVPGAISGSNVEGGGSPGAYLVYTPGGVVRINAGTPAAPNWQPVQLLINAGTPAAPNWVTANGVFVNVGTPAAPNWQPTS